LILEEENLVKRTCKELGITQKELAEIMGVTPHTVTNWSKGKIDKTIVIALEGLIYKSKFVNFQKNMKEFNNFTLKH
jgi:DNA-binding XRE family transcriptional regulator